MSDTFDAPGSRNEAILQNMLGGSNLLEPSGSRIESLLLQLLEKGSGSGGADIPVITMNPSTYICTFTEEQATYMKSGKPFIVEKAQSIPVNYLVTFTTEDGHPYWFGTALYQGGAYFASFCFATSTTGHFYDPTVGTDWQTPIDIPCLYRLFVAPYAVDVGDTNAHDASGSALNNKVFGFSDVGTPGFYEVKTQLLYLNTEQEEVFSQVMTLLVQQASQSGQANVYIPFDAENLLSFVYVTSTVEARDVAFQAGGILFRLKSSTDDFCTFSGTVIVDDTTDPSPTYGTYDIDIHFTLRNIGISVTHKSYTPFSIGD